jgi:hypothetical protein
MRQTALQAQSPEFKTQSHQKKTQKDVETMDKCGKSIHWNITCQ